MKSNFKLKPFLIAFAIFLIILLCFSVLLFMHSIDYDFDNIVEEKTTLTDEDSREPTEKYVSVSSLKGKSNLLFVITDDKSTIEMSFIVIADFDKKSMSVEVVEDIVSLNANYVESKEIGLKNYISSSYNINIDKYAIFTKDNFKKALSLFNGINLNVSEAINYKSSEFNLLLEAGNHTVSGDIAYKYLMANNDITAKELIVCDIINSILSMEYINKSDSLFKSFVNLCVTDISIIDYSDSIDTLATYTKANDKFLPEPYKTGE